MVAQFPDLQNARPEDRPFLYHGFVLAAAFNMIQRQCGTCHGSGVLEDYQDYGMTTVLAGSYECVDCGGEGVTR